MRILLVEDDVMLGEAVSVGLREEGHAVDWVRSAAEAEMALCVGSYAIVLLDLGLPDRAGLEVLRKARAADDRTPFLILSARAETRDRIEGLDAGADDYVVKPFSLAEVFARIRALTRRRAGPQAPVLRAGGIALDPAARTVMRDGHPVVLSPREFNLLQALLEAEGRVLSRRQLEDSLYSWGDEVESNAVQVHVHHLRRKLGAGVIATVRGAGYRIDHGR